MHERLSRRALIAHRWFRVLAVAPLFFVLALMVGRVAPAKLEELASVPSWLIFVGLGAAVWIVGILTPSKLTAALGLKHAPAYPPYWFGAATGMALALFAMTTSAVASEFGLTAAARATLNYWAVFLALIPLGTLALTLIALQFRVRGNETPTIAYPSSPSVTADNLATWVMSDTPVAEPERDMFGHAKLAAVIASRLVQKEASPQAIVGPLGSGKSTIGRLVQNYVALALPEPPIAIVHVELWPYATPRAAVEGLLQALTTAFETEINTSELKGLPNAYGDAIAKLAGVSDWIPKLLQREPLSESEVLASFDDIAVAIGRRFVLWVEDLERFGGGDPGELPNPSELERLAPIRALLLGLGRLRAITVVTASTDLLRRFDVEKIAGYVEEVPGVGLQDARNVIATLRGQWLQGANIIDAAIPAARHRLGWNEREYDPLTDWFALGDHVSDFATAVSALTNTPRTLKQGLRRAHEIWQRQAGEIDLDDVIALCILRESHPNVFALIDKHIKPLRGEHLRRDREPDPLATLKTQVASRGYGEQATLAIKTILDHLFGSDSRGRPQGVAQRRHADYWARFKSQEVVQQRRSDQGILRVLADPADLPLAKLLTKDESAAAVQAFARILSPARVQGLLPVLVEHVAATPPGQWNDEHAPGIVALWNIIRDRIGAIDKKRLEADVESAMVFAATRNLRLMESIVYWFTTSSGGMEDIFNSATAARLLARSQSLLVQHYTGKPNELIAQLRETPRTLLLRLCWGMEAIRAQRLGIPFVEWPTFASTVLEALKIDPETIVPQLSVLITRENAQFTGPNQWTFMPERCEALFGNADELIVTLRTALAGRPTDPRTDAVLEKRVATSTSIDVDDEANDPDAPPPAEEEAQTSQGDTRISEDLQEGLRGDDAAAVHEP